MAVSPPPEFDPPADDRVVDISTPILDDAAKIEETEITPYWDPLNTLMSVFGALLVWGIVTVPQLSNWETIITGLIFMMTASRQFFGFFIALDPHFVPALRVSRILLSVTAFISPVLLLVT